MNISKCKIVLFLFATSSLCFTSCTTLIMKVAGVKKARPTTNESVLGFVKDRQLDYDFLLRPNTDSDLTEITHFMNIGFNSIVIYDRSGNEVGNTNDSTCHMNLRSQITAMLKTGF